MRLIDADALCRSLVDWMFESFGKDDGHDVEFDLINKVLVGIDAAPTADAVPVVHGEWVPVVYGAKTHICSRCSNYAPRFGDGSQHRSVYCPFCGAKMDGGDNHAAD